MNQKFALKRLTASDLTLFEWHFRNRNAGNQKAINLNADIFATLLFPAIEAATRGTGGKVPLDLWIYGPGNAKPLNLQRKIIKWGTYKNWRLDGEFISNTVDEPDRFNSLQPGDFVVFAFEGDVVPVSATAIFVARQLEQDSALHAGFVGVLESATMMILDEAAIARVSTRAKLPSDHPLLGFTLTEELKEIGLGSSKAAERLHRTRRTARLSDADVRRARDAAEETGRLGEQLVAAHLDGKKATGEISDFEWTSAVNAISPFDFRISSSGTIERVDVKTTSGPFNRDLHVSGNELLEMATGGGTYRIFRVYEATPMGGFLRVSEDMKTHAETILAVLRTLPDGVTADAVSISPGRIVFGEPLRLEAPADNDDEG